MFLVSISLILVKKKKKKNTQYIRAFDISKIPFQNWHDFKVVIKLKRFEKENINSLKRRFLYYMDLLRNVEVECKTLNNSILDFCIINGSHVSA